MERRGLIDSDPVTSRVELPDHILHVGCGNNPLPHWLNNVSETRLDINPECSPDIVASITNMGNIGTYDAIFCSHCLEHVYGHEVVSTLKEFHRVLRPGGRVMIFAPDLEGVSPTEEVLFISPAGPITGLDLFYGKQSLVKGMPHMAHHTGFIAPTLKVALEAANFDPVVVNRINTFNLFGAGVKP